MYSSKQKTALFVFFILSGLFFTCACLILNFRAGMLRIWITPDIRRETTMVETTTMEWTEETAVKETVISETSSAHTTVSSVYAEETVPTAAPEETTAEASTEIVYEANLDAYRRSSVFSSWEADSVFLVVFLLSGLLFLGLFLFLFPKTRSILGPDGTVLLLPPCLFLLCSGVLPGTIRVYEGSLRNAGAGILLIFLPRLVLILGLIYALREFSIWLLSRCSPERLLRLRLLKRLDPDFRYPLLHAILPLVLLLLETVLMVVLLCFQLFGQAYRYDVPRALLPCMDLTLLILLAFSFRAFFYGLQTIRTLRDQAIEEAVRNERLRVDLIANVSHDLRTPLTSIIGYGNLLKSETLSAEGAEHLSLLNQKSSYMRELVDSLFELTKVSSGVLQAHPASIDLLRLLEQTIGLFSDELAEKNLTVKRHYESDSCPLVTDGNFLNRVIANLLQNAVKYALPGTRIHLTVRKRPENVDIRLSNVASYEMDFDPEEITERFVRGDKSRTSRGSGLGLAIAKTYTEAIGGKFSVEVDGDQFTAVLQLPNL